jgi:DNA (cytosine-5)-methyltransferase 1
VQTVGTHIDLFSGTGGFALAALWAGFTTDVFCEQDKFCQDILRKHWPNIPIVEDVFEFDGSKYRNATLLTAGVPCQPASCAGKRRGKEDDCWLWPETLRVIGESRPKWLILENVRGLTSLNGGVEFENLLLTLEDSDYETRAFLIPACGVDAQHKRERVWIVAHTKSKSDRRSVESRMEAYIKTKGPGERGYAVWPPEPGVGRLVDGISDRVAKLRAFGNAIVPQVTFQIIKAIKEIENKKRLDFLFNEEYGLQYHTEGSR